MSRMRKVGVAVAPEVALAVWPGAPPLRLPIRGPDSLADAMGAIREAVAGEASARDRRRPPVRVRVVFVPPLADVRRIELPRLRMEETGAVLARHPGRYFPAARDPQVVAWSPLERPTGGSQRLLAAAVPTVWVEAARDAVLAAGGLPDDAVPAHPAWAAAGAVRGVRDGVVLVDLDARAVVVALRGGRVADAAALPANDTALVESRLRELAEEGATVRLDGDPAKIAAVNAFRAASKLTLVPPTEAAARDRLRRRRNRVVWAAAAALLVVAGALELWGEQRELDAVVAARRAIASEVRTAMDERAALNERRAALTVIDTLEATAPRWSVLLAGIARGLPQDAYLAALRGGPDSVFVVGVAGDAAPVFAGLRGIPGVAAVRAQAPIRREARPDGAVERFTLAIGLRRNASGDAP